VVAWLPVVLWAGVIFALSAIPGTRLPSLDFPQSDKAVHALLYGVLGALIRRALGRTRSAGTARANLAAAVLIATAYGITDEIHQLWTPHRSADWRDVVADAGGAALGVGMPGALSLVAMQWMKFRGCFMMVRSKNRQCSPTREPR
jgi:VanZ family protein